MTAGAKGPDADLPADVSMRKLEMLLADEEEGRRKDGGRWRVA
jgi:hypothetical protein